MSRCVWNCGILRLPPKRLLCSRGSRSVEIAKCSDCCKIFRQFTGQSSIFSGKVGATMARLVFDCDGVDIITQELIGDVVSIGRAPSNDIVIDDPTVSAQHSSLTKSPGG